MRCSGLLLPSRAVLLRPKAGGPVGHGLKSQANQTFPSATLAVSGILSESQKTDLPRGTGCSSDLCPLTASQRQQLPLINGRPLLSNRNWKENNYYTGLLKMSKHYASRSKLLVTDSNFSLEGDASLWSTPGQGSVPVRWWECCPLFLGKAMQHNHQALFRKHIFPHSTKFQGNLYFLGQGIVNGI